MKASPDLSQQLLGAIGRGAQVQAEGAAGAVALVLTAQRQVGLGSGHTEKSVCKCFAVAVEGHFCSS